MQMENHQTWGLGVEKHPEKTGFGRKGGLRQRSCACCPSSNTISGFQEQNKEGNLNKFGVIWSTQQGLTREHTRIGTLLQPAYDTEERTRHTHKGHSERNT